MALGLPINLMSVAAPPTQSTSAPAVTDSTAVQPAKSTGDTQDTSAGDSNSNTGNGSAQQQAFPARTATQAKPDRAAPNSVVSAQAQSDQDATLAAARRQAERGVDIARTKALIDSVAATPATGSALLERPNKVDRYAPPDPLPTAPILKKQAPRQIETPTS